MRKALILIVAALAVCSAVPAASAQADDFRVEVASPGEVQQGNVATISANVSAGKALKGESRNVTVELSISEKTLNTTTIEIDRGESKTVNWSILWDKPGTYSIEVTAEYDTGMFDSESASDSASLTVSENEQDSTDAGDDGSDNESTGEADPTPYEMCKDRAEESWKLTYFQCNLDFGKSLFSGYDWF